MTDTPTPTEAIVTQLLCETRYYVVDANEAQPNDESRDLIAKIDAALRATHTEATSAAPDDLREALIAELSPLIEKVSQPNGWEWMFPLRVNPVDGKPTIVAHKGGNLFRGYIGTWQEADLLVALANAAPRIIAALSAAPPAPAEATSVAPDGLREAIDGWFVTDEADIRGRYQIRFRGKHVEYVISEHADIAYERMTNLRWDAIAAALSAAPPAPAEATSVEVEHTPMAVAHLAYEAGFGDTRFQAARLIFRDQGNTALQQQVYKMVWPDSKEFDGAEIYLAAALDEIDGEGPQSEPRDGPTVGFPPSSDPETDDGNDIVEEAFREGVIRGRWEAAKIARAAIATLRTAAPTDPDQ